MHLMRRGAAAVTATASHASRRPRQRLRSRSAEKTPKIVSLMIAARCRCGETLNASWKHWTRKGGEAGLRRRSLRVLTASATAPSTCTTASAQPVVRATVTTAPTRDGTQLRHIAVTKRNDAILTVRGPYLIVHLRIVRHHVRRQSAGERNLAAADHLNRWPHCSQRMLSHPPCFSIGSQQAGQRRSDDLAHRSVVASRT